ncbi:hypothetical protein [Phytoactinopolyspora mesophila]|uniref:Uncharacterized protein n=1 Tax=Phytoactinopolyspora mesophila TaxID=2650750 RepID=A0A7K3LYK7_9ACTN|nr:hypothetical protein [Phytoactinopolyspora mesophila]NDL56089.1 hypothetical protein [Phytoactinopolyspora mesophila]
MSTLAIWLLVVVAVLFVLAVLTVVLALRSTYRKSRTLAHEVNGLSEELEHVVGSLGNDGTPDR